MAFVDTIGTIKPLYFIKPMLTTGHTGRAPSNRACAQPPPGRVLASKLGRFLVNPFTADLPKLLHFGGRNFSLFRFFPEFHKKGPCRILPLTRPLASSP